MLRKLKKINFLQKNTLFSKLEIIKNIEDLNKFRSNYDQISFVPTMGNLHDGHISLIKKANKYNDTVITSIFINPLQFNDNNDFINYPKTLDSDINLLIKNECNCLFLPDQSILNNIKQIESSYKSQHLCGLNRPGHFDGVLTIVNKLFELIRPTRAIFGKKDYQQLLLISDFVKESKLPISIIGSEIVRDQSGLALSSRNNHLSTDEKKLASNLYKSLEIIANKVDTLTINDIVNEKNKLRDLGFSIDYLNVCNPQELSEESNYTIRPLIVAIAAYIREIRLIDNILIT